MQSISKLEFNWLGLKWLEPITIITDIIISIVCFYAFYKLKKINNRLPEQILFNYFFLFNGFSFLIGGLLGHGLNLYTGQLAHIYSWLLGVVGVFFLVMSILLKNKLLMNPKTYILLSIINVLAMLISWYFVFEISKFIVAEIHAIFGVILIGLSVEFFGFKKLNYKSSFYYFSGIFILILASLVHVLKLSISDLWFNHNDLGHIVIAIAMVMFYYFTLNMENSSLKSSDQL